MVLEHLKISKNRIGVILAWVFLILKVSLDFFSDLRTIGFFNVLFYISAFLLLSGFNSKKPIKINAWVLIALLYSGLNVVIGGDVIFNVKLLSSIILFHVFKDHLKSLPFKEVDKLQKVFFTIMILSVIILYLVSAFTSNHHREFLFFEHANLLGNVLVFFSIGSLVFSRGWIEKFIWPILTLISTSTGAFIISMVSVISPKLITKRRVLIIFTGVISIIVLVFFITKTLNSEIHNKVFGLIYIFSSHYGFSDFFENVRDSVLLKDIEQGHQSSLTWRLYAWLKYIISISESNFFNLLFGNGALSFKEVWEGNMPHNDLLLLTYDFGVIGALGFVIGIIRLIKKIISVKTVRWMIIFMLFGRLMVENVIYSFYTITYLSIILSFIYSKYEKSIDSHRDVPSK